MPTRSYTSPDRRLVFLVVEEAGDVALGFEGCPWHTHADLLLDGSPAGETAVEAFLEALFQDRLVIAVFSQEGRVQDTWITLDPAEDLQGLQAGEAIELRYWSGRPWRADELT